MGIPVVRLAALALLVVGCHAGSGASKHHADASTKQAPVLGLDGGDTMDWKPACALGREIGVPGTVGVPYWIRDIKAPGFRQCTNGDGQPIMFTARGYDDGVRTLELMSYVRGSAGTARMLSTASALALRAVGLRIPPRVRRVLATGGAAHAESGGRTFAARRDNTSSDRAMLSFAIHLQRHYRWDSTRVWQ